MKKNSVSLIVVAQAMQLFDFDTFYEEALRVLKKNGIVAVIGYTLFKIEK